MTEVNNVNGANGGNNQPSTTKLTIKKNQGITQALFDLVKQMKSEGKAEISDGKITAQEWNQTINKIAELQRMREEIGGQKIYSGGSDRKDYHGSFIVHPNQEIEFTAEEMNALYEAMGVTIKSNAPAAPPAPAAPAAPPAPTAPAAPAAPAAPPAPVAPAAPETPQVSSDNIPQDDANPPKAINLSKSSLTNIEQTKDMSNCGKSMVKDSASGNSYNYDEAGYVTHTYDENGNCTRRIARVFGETVDFYFDYEYDKDGNRTREITRNADGKVKNYTDFEPDKDGIMTGVTHNADGTVNNDNKQKGDVISNAISKAVSNMEEMMW